MEKSTPRKSVWVGKKTKRKLVVSIVYIRIRTPYITCKDIKPRLIFTLNASHLQSIRIPLVGFRPEGNPWSIRGHKTHDQLSHDESEERDDVWWSYFQNKYKYWTWFTYLNILPWNQWWFIFTNFENCRCFFWHSQTISPNWRLWGCPLLPRERERCSERSGAFRLSSSEDSHGRHFYISYTVIQKLDFTVGTVIVHKWYYRIITNLIYIYHNTPKILGQRNIFQTFLEPSRFARVDSGPACVLAHAWHEEVYPPCN